MGKKKATGMSKRLGFTDRQTITENKDILRYNERLEREAQGLPPEGPKGPRGRGDRPAARPAREPRPVRPPALDDEQVTTLRTAYQGVVGESGLEAAAELVLTQLAGHASFERATMAGWDLASGGHADDRTAEQWELLRTAWLSIRVALLEAYVVIKPDAQELLDRERKQQARLAKPQRQRRRPGRSPSERKPKAAPTVAAAPGTPSPSAVARASRAVSELPPAVADPDAPTAPSGVDQPPAEVTPDIDAPPAEPVVETAVETAADPVEPAAEPEPGMVDGAEPEPVETEPAAAAEPEPEPEAASAEPEPEPESAVEPEPRETEPEAIDTAIAEPEQALASVPAEPVEDPEPPAVIEDATDEVPDEHAGYVVPAEVVPAEPEPDDDQLMLEF